MPTEMKMVEDKMESQNNNIENTLSSSIPNQSADSKDEPIIRFKRLLGTVTLEPIVFILSLAMNMIGLSMSSLAMFKICRVNFNIDAVTCHNLTNNKSLEAEVQKVATTYQIYDGAIETVPALICVIFLGPWSDKFGRKLPLVLSLTTLTAALIVPILVAAIEESSPLILLLMPAIMSLSGGSAGALVIFNSFISDITDEKTRTIRLGVISAVGYLGILIGTISAGYILTALGYIEVFSLGLFLAVLALVYCIFVIKETLPNRDSSSPKSSLKDFFNIKNLRESFRTCIKERPNNKRKHFWLLAICKWLALLGNAGRMHYLYARLMFQWSDQMFSYYSAFVVAVDFSASVLLLPFLKKFVKICDAHLFLLGLCGYVVWDIIVGYSTAGWMLFAASLILVDEFVFAPVGSLLTQCVEADEVGKIFSVLAVFDSLITILNPMLFSKIYNATNTDPKTAGTVYLVSAAVYVVIILLMCYVIHDMWLTNKHLDQPPDQSIDQQTTQDSSDKVVVSEFHNPCFNEQL